MNAMSIVSQKGGVGKTTVALNLSYSFARQGARVVVIDTDPQGAILSSLASQEQRPGLAEIIFHGLPIDDCLVHTRMSSLSLLPFGQLEACHAHALAEHFQDGTRLRQLLSKLEDRYDLAVIDTPSGFTGITLGALRASRFVLSPLQAEPIAARSLTQLLELLGSLRDEGAELELAGVVLSMLQLRNPDSFAVAQEIWERLPEHAVCRATIPRDPTFLTASAAGVPVGLLSRRPPPVATVFDQLAQELSPSLLLDDGEDDGPIALLG